MHTDIDEAAVSGPSGRPTRCHLSAVVALVAIVLATAARLASAAEAAAATDASAPDTRILVMLRMEPAHFRPDVDYGDGYSGRAALAARQRTAHAVARTHGLQVLSHWPLPAIGVECYVMRLPSTVSQADALEAIERDARAAWAQPIHVFGGRSYRDPLYDLQPSARAWQLHRLHQTASGRGVRIAQIDSGVEIDHPDLQEQLESVQNTVERNRYAAEQHGTAVAGVLVARADNGVGMVGIAPGARLLVLRGCRESAPGAAICDTLALARALQLALDGKAQIVNLSLGGPPDRLLAALLDAALARGVTVVAAAGTDGRDDGFPASHAGVIAVTDIAAPMQQAALAADGTDVPTTLPGARWGLASGSSFAAAAVSGVAALLLELKPTADARQIHAWLGLRAQPVATTAPGAPLAVDACHSVALAAGRCVCDCGEAAAATAVTPSGLASGALVAPRRSSGTVGLALP